MTTAAGSATETATATATATDEWEAFGFERADAVRWQALGMTPFESAMARGDGFGPAFAGHYRRQLRRIAEQWEEGGLDTPEGLRCHLAGLTARQARATHR